MVICDDLEASAASLEAEGWRSFEGTHFNKHVGPFWQKRSGDDLVVGLMTDDRHNNGYVGTVHGGVLMTFADIALGMGVAQALNSRDCVTLQLQFNFTSAARIGSFLTCRPEVVRRTSQIVFVRGLVHAGDRVIGSADGLWKVLDPEKLASLKAG